MNKITQIKPKELWNKVKSSKFINSIKSGEAISRIKTEAKKLLERIKIPQAALIAFVILFILDLVCLCLLTQTPVVISCMLLVIEVGLAACLAHCNYGILGLIAIAEFIVGIISKNILVAIFAVLIYFLALLVIHIMRVYKGETTE